MEPELKVLQLPDGPLCYREAGPGEAPVLLCLHGFPESWLAYEALMPRLSHRFRLIVPDQRGFNRSLKPDGVEAYHARYLTADMFALADHVSPDRPIFLMGHDWGSAVAYAMAFRRPERIARLVIANGVHPWCFQRAIIEDEGQRAASQYMNRLRADDAETLLAADGFARLIRMMEGFSDTPWLNADLKQRYVDQWSEPGALTGMLNWYRSSPVLVPGIGEAAPVVPLLAAPRDTMRVAMPHMVLWGDADTALRPACLEGLGNFAADLTIRNVEGAGHWILHERPDVVASAMLTFLI